MRIVAPVLLLLCLGSASGPGHAQSSPMTVTSDSLCYCDNLLHRLPPTRSDEVDRLRREGKTMCEAGHVRGGIMQLRRALLLAHAEKSASP